MTKKRIKLTACVLAIFFFLSLLGHSSNILRNSFVNSSSKSKVSVVSIFQLGSRTCMNHSLFILDRGILYLDHLHAK